MHASTSGCLPWMDGLHCKYTKKSGIGHKFATGKRIATDSIKLNGLVFPALDPKEAHKQLGIRVALNGDFSEEKSHVMQEMQHRLSALKIDNVLLPMLREMGIKI